MSRTRPSSDPISFHKPTGQFYVTRGGSRVYLGADRDSAIERYHRMALGLAEVPKQVSAGPLSAKKLANRFIVTQQANWRNHETTLKGYSDWLKRFLEDHPRLQADEFTVEMFAAWKLSLRQRGYAPRIDQPFPQCRPRDLQLRGRDRSTPTGASIVSR